jgi:hypothetical protein
MFWIYIPKTGYISLHLLHHVDPTCIHEKILNFKNVRNDINQTKHYIYIFSFYRFVYVQFMNRKEIAQLAGSELEFQIVK